jgi:prepilin peptidase CpaA
MDAMNVLQSAALLGLLASAVFFDVRERRIPNLVTGPGLLVGLVLAAFAEGGFPGSALAGAGVALAATFPLVILGGLGAGDAKLLTAVGAYVGLGGLLPVLVFGGIAGGIMALASAVRRGAILGVLVNMKNLLLHHVTLGRRGHRIRLDSPGAATIPYGVAISAGALVAWFFPAAIPGIL